MEPKIQTLFVFEQPATPPRREAAAQIQISQPKENNQIQKSMNTTEMLTAEKNRSTKETQQTIHLYAEGTFYHAYEWSAWLCCQFINSFKTTRRENKKAKTDIVSIGFPISSLEKYTPAEARTEQAEEGHLIWHLPDTLIKDPTNLNEQYTRWRSAIPMTEAKTKSNAPLPVLADHPVSITGIMKQVLAFRVESHSPMECMQFLLDIQTQLVGSL